MTKEEAIEMLKALDMMLRSPDGEPISDVCEALCIALSALSAEAVQGWIPCEERLPSESGWYVISVVGFENITDVSYFYSDELKWSDVSHTQSVTAWMPLPKPYEPKTERRG